MCSQGVILNIEIDFKQKKWRKKKVNYTRDPPPFFTPLTASHRIFYNCWMAPKVQNRQILFTRLTRGTNPQPDHVMLRQRKICCLDSGCPDFSSLVQNHSSCEGHPVIICGIQARSSFLLKKELFLLKVSITYNWNDFICYSVTGCFFSYFARLLFVQLN